MSVMYSLYYAGGASPLALAAKGQLGAIRPEDHKQKANRLVMKFMMQNTLERKGYYHSVDLVLFTLCGSH